ncbi:MAG: dTDP-glucose 4,6-dehydratase [Candidatus Marinimicrobia bacterium]|nr:dTDP-glucose 4,6-dehydratase [Candidatus Neomarinimicrobiota bacterium]|tara:strand:+ start:131 stop:1186 length:1056 start_codon:yes stop_codon:yes gene_type:complete
MKILVTGGAGFIGSNFIQLMIKKYNNSIVNIDKLTYAGNINSLKEIENHPNYKFYHLDIEDSDKIKQVFNSESPDIIVNLAAESHVDRSIDTPIDFVQTNVIGTVKLLQSSLNYYNNLDGNKKPKFKFLHISTDEVYGSLPYDGKFLETTPYNPSSPYSASKASSDHFVRAWNKTYCLPTLITNCSNNYGPYQFPEKLIPVIIQKCLLEEDLPVYGKGENVRDWLFVEDHCEAIYNVLINGKIGETYNIGGNSERKNIDVVNEICKIMDQLRPRKNKLNYNKLIKYVENRPGHDFRYAVDISKIIKNLDWKPNISFEEGIRKTIIWYLENQNWINSIQDGSYKITRHGLVY